MTVGKSRVIGVSGSIDLTGIGFSAEDVAAPSGRMRVFSAGSGPVLLLLHGIGGGAGAFYWHRLGPLLARRYRVIAPDFVGWAGAEHPRRSLGFADYVAEVEALLDRFGPVAAVLAQSLAAGFAIAALRDRPGSAERLVLLAPTGGKDFGRDAFPPLLRYTLGLIARIPGMNMALYRAYFHRRQTIGGWLARRGFVDPAKIPDALIEAGLWSATRPNAAWSALPFLTGALRYDLAPLLAAIDRPALMLWGAEETQIRPEIRARLAMVNPRLVTTVTIPSARTNFEVEQAETTAAAILSFLDAPPQKD